MEILAPAGNLQCAQAAIHNGADAIYLGYSAFSARQSAENFSIETLQSLVRDAHACGVLVYVAMNTLIKDKELDEFLSTLSAVWSAGVDAIILQDVLLGKEIKRQRPDIVLHLSTQAGVCNVNGALFAKECGFSRVILARETPLFEIEKITQIIETEVFVQGALCTCFSGQCYFSSFAGGNSGNRGRCKQPCRKQYTYNRPGYEEKAYALSLSDLCVGEDIHKLVQAGVSSFKIEGRMRRPEYVAAAVRYYRALLDVQPETIKAQCLSDLKRTYNRGNYTKGLAFGQDKRFLSTSIQGHLGEKVGVVKVINGKYVIESKFLPQTGDAFKILRDGKEVGGAFFVKAVKSGFEVKSNTRLKNGDAVFITTDTAVNARVLSSKRKGTFAIRLTFTENEYAVAKCGDVTIYSQEKLSSANNRALTVEEVKTCFEKTDALLIEIVFEDIQINGNIFIAKSALNAFRRSFFEKLVAAHRTQPQACFSIRTELLQGSNRKIAVMGDNFADVSADIIIYKPKRYGEELPITFTAHKAEKYIYYPAFCGEQEETWILRCIKNYRLDGVYAENYGAIQFAKEHNLAVFAGTGLNVFNRVAVAGLLQLPFVRYYAVSKELNEAEAQALMGSQAFMLQSGNIKLMDLCYCPFEKKCSACDKKDVYQLTDEAGRVFPVRRYVAANGQCRFEVYNCAQLIGGEKSAYGTLLDCTLIANKQAAVTAVGNPMAQKEIYQTYTSGHAKRGVL